MTILALQRVRCVSRGWGDGFVDLFPGFELGKWPHLMMVVVVLLISPTANVRFCVNLSHWGTRGGKRAMLGCSL